jgi:hypothetical protein
MRICTPSPPGPTSHASRFFGLKHNLAPLATLASLRQLDLTDSHTLDGLERFEQLECGGLERGQLCLK